MLTFLLWVCFIIVAIIMLKNLIVAVIKNYKEIVKGMVVFISFIYLVITLAHFEVLHLVISYGLPILLLISIVLISYYVLSETSKFLYKEYLILKEEQNEKV